MQHIDLTGHEEAVKQFFLILPPDPDGSLIELNGQAVARVHRVGNETDAAGPPAPMDAGLAKVYEILGRRHNSGFTDTAARHNEHQS
ncbi:MAG TPA: hypothetical protein VF306_06455 [Pirellulales bacterium]